MVERRAISTRAGARVIVVLAIGERVVRSATIAFGTKSRAGGGRHGAAPRGLERGRAGRGDDQRIETRDEASSTSPGSTSSLGAYPSSPRTSTAEWLRRFRRRPGEYVRPVLAEHVAQDVGDLAERRARAERLLHRRQQVAVPARRPSTAASAASDRGAVARRPERAQRVRSARRPRRRRSAGARAVALILDLEPVDPDDHPLAVARSRAGCGTPPRGSRPGRSPASIAATAPPIASIRSRYAAARAARARR